MRVTPSLPQWGRQPKGGIPLTPPFFGVFYQHSEGFALFGDARAAGAEAQCTKSPHEGLLVSLQNFYRAEIIMGNYHRSLKRIDIFTFPDFSGITNTVL